MVKIIHDQQCHSILNDDYFLKRNREFTGQNHKTIPLMLVKKVYLKPSKFIRNRITILTYWIALINTTTVDLTL